MGKIKTFLLMFGLMVLFMYTGDLIDGADGMKTAFLLACGVNFFAYFFSDKMVLSHYKAVQIHENNNTLLYPMVQRLAHQAGIPMPKVYIVPDKTPNAFATGRNPSHAAVAVNEGLLDLLSEEEIEGVLAHELSHIKHRDILISSVAAVFVGAITYLARIAQYRNNGRNGKSSVLPVLLSIILIPLAAIILQMSISRTREYAADKGSALITGHSEWLISALSKLDDFSHKMPMHNVTDATAHMFIVNPLSDVSEKISSLFSTHPSTHSRIEHLTKIKNEM